MRAITGTHHRHHWPLPYPISYLHNYGPGPAPGTFAYYDGPRPITAGRARQPISGRIAAGTPAIEVPLLALSGQV